MTTATTEDVAIRDRILARPAMVLEDPALMRALADATDAGRGQNVIDLRSIAMERLEARLDRLEDTHRSVVAAAYDNVSGAAQIHRAVLRLIEARTLDAFVDALEGDVADILRLSALRLVIEACDPAPEADAGATGDETLALVPEGFVDAYLGRGRRATSQPVTLRARTADDSWPDGPDAAGLGSEACLRLDLGAGHPAAMLWFGSRDPYQFGPNQGTDLLDFLAGVAERALTRLLP